MGYDDYYGKHAARFYGWLPASKKHKDRLKKKPLKYFTLCAEEAIDIFMLEKEGVLQRDSNKELPNVFICEKENNIASKILNLVRPPLKEAIFVGALDIILTFQEDAQTMGRDLEDDDKNFHIRQKLITRRLFHRLKSAFPFDIINFDPYGNLLDNNKDSNKRLMESLRKVFELQASLDSFLMFITIPLSDIHGDYLKKFKEDLEENVESFEEISNALTKKFKTTDFNKIQERNRLAIGFSKSVIAPIAKDYDWQSEHQGIYVYQNMHKRLMLSSVVLFTKTEYYNTDLYVQDILRVISEMPNYYPFKEPFGDKIVTDHVTEVVNYREQLRSTFT